MRKKRTVPTVVLIGLWVALAVVIWVHIYVYTASSQVIVPGTRSGGGILSVWSCIVGNCTALSGADGAALNFSAVDMQDNTEGLFSGVDNTGSCALATGDGQICWDGVLDKLYIGNGTTTSQIAGVSTIDLDGAFDNGKIINGADSLANAFEVNNDDAVSEGEDVSGWRFFSGAGGPQIDCFVGEDGCDQAVNVPSGKDFIINLDGTEVLNIDADTGDVTLSGVLKETKTIEIPAGSFGVDGTQCIKNADVTINSETEPLTVTCTDNDAAIIKFRFRAPAAWDETTLTIDLAMVTLAATPTGNLNIDWSGYCVGHSDLYGTDSYTAEDANGAMDFSVAEAQNDLIIASTTGQVPIGTCSEGDIVKLRGAVDATGTTSTDMADIHFLSAFVHIAMNDWSN